jgi:hypothetical protein
VVSRENRSFRIGENWIPCIYVWILISGDFWIQNTLTKMYQNPMIRLYFTRWCVCNNKPCALVCIFGWLVDVCGLMRPNVPPTVKMTVSAYYAVTVRNLRCNYFGILQIPILRRKMTTLVQTHMHMCTHARKHTHIHTLTCMLTRVQSLTFAIQTKLSFAAC